MTSPEIKPESNNPDTVNTQNFQQQSEGAPHQGSAGSEPENRTQTDTRSPVERAAGVAREQANEAADAWRRGEFMHNAAVDPEANSDDRLIALLSYITQVLVPVIMPLIVLLSESSKNRPFQRYHAVQSLALSVTFIVLGFMVAIGAMIISILPVIGWLIGPVIGIAVVCLSPIAYLMAVIALLYYGYQAYQGKRFAIPGLTSLLHQQGWLK